ncbi:MAG: TonB-dependent receptor [Paludibacter sp.]|nr:TonB-dependent receptor [Paludibacter sp.]
MRRVLLVFCILLNVELLFAADIVGVVRDAQTGEVLIGASVYVKGQKQLGTTSGLDGTFVLNHINASKIVLVCSYISYQTLEKEITVKPFNNEKILLKLVSYETELRDVTVIAAGKTTDFGVRNMERLSNKIVNIVGARSIEISPDLTVANVLGRISGVTMERNSSGEAEYAVLRGMDKRYNITLVNGVKISSPNNKQRFVPLNIFPSELLDRLEVSKTRSAETEGDATGGAVNMVMKDAPAKFSFRANLSVGYSTMFFNRQFSKFDKSDVIQVAPYEQYGKDYLATMDDFGNKIYGPKNCQPLPNLVAGLSFGNRLLNRKFGYVFAFNYQNQNKGTNSTYFEDKMTQQVETVKLTSYKIRDYSESQIQYGAHAKFDYIFSPNNKIEWYNFLVANENAQIRQSVSTSLNLYYDPESGNFNKSIQTRMRTTDQQVFASTLQGEHNIGKKLQLNWTAIYSKAGLQHPDLVYVNLDNLVTNYADDITVDGDGSTREWQHNADRDLSAKFDLKCQLLSGKNKLNLQTGGLFRQKNRDNFKVSYRFQPPKDTYQEYESIDQLVWNLYNPKGSVDQTTYTAFEKIGAGYFQTRYERGKAEVIAGVRVEYTDQGYHMDFPNYNEDPDGSKIYTDILPDLQLKYSPNSKINWRAGYYRSINRPGFFDIVPYTIMEEDNTEYGNKDLERAVIDNVDVRWEFFPKPIDQLLIGAFYKYVRNPIEYVYTSVNNRQYGYWYDNLGNARNIGLEVNFIKFVRAFGIKANYTYTNSEITTPKVYYNLEENGKKYTKNQTRPLVGQAAHVANISLLYKDTEHGWNAQLASSYVGAHIVTASVFLNSDYWEKGAFQMDLSIEKIFNNGLSLFMKVNNLLNTPSVEYIPTHNDYNDKFPLQSATSGETLIRKDYYGRLVLIGARFKL